MRRVTLVMLACATIGCSSGPEDMFKPPLPDAFAGSWRSVTPPLEFLRLSVTSLSSQQGVLEVQLAFSGVAWEGAGRIDGDSLVADMAVAGVPTPSGLLVAHVRDAQTLLVRFRSGTAAPLDVTFAREN